MGHCVRHVGKRRIHPAAIHKPKPSDSSGRQYVKFRHASGNQLGDGRLKKVSEMSLPIIKTLTLGAILRVVVQIPERLPVAFPPMRELSEPREPHSHAFRLSSVRRKGDYAFLGERKKRDVAERLCENAKSCLWAGWRDFSLVDRRAPRRYLKDLFERLPYGTNQTIAQSRPSGLGKNPCGSASFRELTMAFAADPIDSPLSLGHANLPW